MAGARHVYGTESMARAGEATPVDNEVLTNGVLAGDRQIWYRYVASGGDPIRFDIDLHSLHHICNARVQFSTMGKVWDWSLYTSHAAAGAGYSEVLQVRDPAWDSWGAAGLLDPRSPRSS